MLLKINEQLTLQSENNLYICNPVKKWELNIHNKFFSINYANNSTISKNRKNSDN
jgi:hypothetical protein